MSETIAGKDIDICAFLSLEDNKPLSIFIGHDHGCEVITLEEFAEDSMTGLSQSMCQRYACAFEVMAKQLRGKL